MSEVTDIHEHAHGDVEGLSNRLNWLRAGVLGANDGIVSVAGLVMGVAGATTDRTDILIAGIAALVAGALSMGAGEYVSVSTQRDAELAIIEAEKQDLAAMPDEELDHLTEILQGKGLSYDVARSAAEELSKKDVLRAHAEFEFGLDLDDVTNPWNAAFASMIAFTVGGVLPMLTILLPTPARYYVTALVVAIALAITGYSSARFSSARPMPAVLRNVGGGVFAMVVTLLIGRLLGTQIG
ncbi:MAG: VIT1/CCC1 transporter family protein [Nocardioides sp.]|jgi:VIT1/CCC1 family predicted Fe2+/Mn2+ transporter